ncbi:MAG TPA: RAMP superfamily CRISPR-associated protein [Limnochordia bacterium]|nr:RAMP superfamily CRISPR-associated protein [Limnochordia bacterium]HPZ31805.1 RAMP superfamily CRISPR-associated protein [Limnochordia bacterium]
MGSIECWLQALTPLVVGQKQFIRRAGVPCIPGTSLKGVIRSTCELVGNGCASIGRDIDDAHKPCYTRNRLCITCRMFGFLKKEQCYEGNVSFSDAVLVSSKNPVNRWQREQILLSSPKPRHKAFYSSKDMRKIYHHQPGKARISNVPSNMRNRGMIRTVETAPPGSVFSFDVQFQNLSAEKFSLLLYALVLEKGMAHKIGGARPLGAGSSVITIEKIVYNDAAKRYAGEPDKVLTGAELESFVAEQTRSLREDKCETMEALRVLMRYDPHSKKVFRYPDWRWFKDNPTRQLLSWREYANSRD